MDVLQYDRNTYATGIRGLHGRYSNRTLSLLDGRSAESPIFGGPEFFRLPLFLEDIDRIEVVRGPGGAAWGANAFTGVINIITKDPNDCLGWLESTTINEFGDSYTHLREADKKDKWRWRMSVGYEDRETSDEAISDSDFDSHDFSRNYRYDFKTIYDYSETTTWSMGTGYSHIEAGNFDAGGGTYSRELRRFESGRLFAKVDKAFSDTTTGHLQWTGNFRLTNITSKAIGGDQGFSFRDGSVDEYLAGLFAIDRWKVTDRLTVEGQIRGDSYSDSDRLIRQVDILIYTG